MSSESQPQTTRHALGLPQGSIRTIYVILVAATLILLLWLPAKPAIPPYVLYLTFLLLVHYSVLSSQVKENESPPLGLSIALLRFLVIGGLLFTIGWQVATDLQSLRQQIIESMKMIQKQPFLPVLMLAVFFFGQIMHGLLKRVMDLYVLRDIEAWVGNIGCMVMMIAGIAELVKHPHLSEPIEVGTYAALTISFYVGARS